MSGDANLAISQANTNERRAAAAAAARGKTHKQLHLLHLTNIFLAPLAPGPVLLGVCIFCCALPECQDRTGRDKGSPVGVFTAGVYTARGE